MLCVYDLVCMVGCMWYDVWFVVCVWCDTWGWVCVVLCGGCGVGLVWCFCGVCAVLCVV